MELHLAMVDKYLQLNTRDQSQMRLSDISSQIGISRQLTRAEQDSNKSPKSLISYTSVKITPEAHRIYFEKNPKIAAKCAAVRASHDNTAAVASGSGVASSAVPSTQVPQPPSLGGTVCSELPLKRPDLKHRVYYLSLHQLTIRIRADLTPATGSASSNGVLRESRYRRFQLAHDGMCILFDFYR